MHPMAIKTFLKAMLLPPAGPLLLAFVGVLVVGRRLIVGRLLVLAGVGSLWLLSIPVVSDGMADLVPQYPPFDAQAPTTAHAIVILGGGGQRAYAPEYRGPAADPWLLERLAYGAFLARGTGLPILVTGFHVEAAAMHDSLSQLFGVEARWVDDQSFDTFENAKNAAQLLKRDGIHRVILVTHATHMWRSAHEFSDAGIEVIPAPVGARVDREPGYMPYVPNVAALLRSYSAVYELLGNAFRVFLTETHLRRHREPEPASGAAVVQTSKNVVPCIASTCRSF